MDCSVGLPPPCPQHIPPFWKSSVTDPFSLKCDLNTALVYCVGVVVCCSSVVTSHRETAEDSQGVSAGFPPGALAVYQLVGLQLINYTTGCWELTMFKGCMFAIIIISLSSSGVSGLFISLGGKPGRSEGGGKENISLCPFHFFLMHPFLNILYILCIYQKLQYFIDWYLSVNFIRFVVVRHRVHICQNESARTWNDNTFTFHCTSLNLLISTLKWLPHWCSVRTNLRFRFLWMGWRFWAAATSCLCQYVLKISRLW